MMLDVSTEYVVVEEALRQPRQRHRPVGSTKREREQRELHPLPLLPPHHPPSSPLHLPISTQFSLLFFFSSLGNSVSRLPLVDCYLGTHSRHKASW